MIKKISLFAYIVQQLCVTLQKDHKLKLHK